MNPSTVITIAKLVGLSPEQVIGYIQSKFKGEDEIFRTCRAQARNKKKHQIIGQGLQTALLDLLYPDSELVKQGLFRYRFAIAGQEISLSLASSKDWTDLTVKLGGAEACYELKNENEYLERHVISNEDAIVAIRNYLEEGRKIINLPLYRLLRMHAKKESCLIEFGLTDFVRYVTTCGFFEDELFQALIDTDLAPAKTYAGSAGLMPLRKQFLPDAASLVNFEGRLCAGGISVLLALVRPHPYNDFVFIVKKRSAEVAAGHGLLSLVPMGYHQPLTVVHASRDVALEATVFREMFEEVFGGTEPILQASHRVPEWCMSAHPETKWFSDNPGDFVLEMVGFAMSLLLGDYNAAILLAVLNPDYWERFASKFASSYEHEWMHDRLVSTKNETGIANLLRDPNLVDPGRFTLIRALKRLRKLEPGRVKLPDLIEF